MTPVYAGALGSSSVWAAHGCSRAPAEDEESPPSENHPRYCHVSIGIALDTGSQPYARVDSGRRTVRGLCSQYEA
jgi:hypothetical protein